MIRGDAAGELNAHKHVAEVLLRSGEPIAAVPHIIRYGGANLVKTLELHAYVDLRHDILEGIHWERATALNILASENDLVPDDHVDDYVEIALAGTSEPDRSPFAPHVSLMTWKAISALSDRLTESDAVAVLTLLDKYIEREPNKYRHTDDDHIAAVARIFDAHPPLANWAAEHLAKLVLQEFNLGETVRSEARRSITDPSLLLDALQPHAATSEAAARILSDYGRKADESLEGVAQRIETTLNAPPPEPGRFAFGTDLPNLAQRARDLDEQTRTRLAEHCMSLAEDESQPSPNRSEGMEGVLLLAHSVSEATRSALFDRTLPLARIDLPLTAVDLMLPGNHPLSAFRVNLDNSALSRFALTAAAHLASTLEDAQGVQDRAFSWLGGDERAINALARALEVIEPAHITIDPAVLAHHPSRWLRQIAALLAARSTPPAGDVLRKLAADQDRHVRRNVALLLSRIDEDGEHLATELREVLQADTSWMVRKAASRV